MTVYLKIVLWILPLIGCGHDFNISDTSDRRALRNGVQQGADAEADIPSKKDTTLESNSGTSTTDPLPPPSPQNEKTDKDPPPDTLDPDEPALDPAAEGDPDIIVFRIAQGTGRGSWNTQQNMIRANVGQTIRFVNDDSIVHRLHTNGAPCPHGTQFLPGNTYDCVVTRTFNSASGPLYDHNVGTSAEVWLETTNANATFSLVDEREVENIERPAPRCGDD